MKKHCTILFALTLALGATAQAQKSTATGKAANGILNHLDIGVNVGTVGIGIDVAMPIGNYVRIRAGYQYMPRFSVKEDFSVETSTGGSIEKFFNKRDRIGYYLNEYGIDIDDPKLANYKNALDRLMDKNVGLTDKVKMAVKPQWHQFKFMVDVLPFKRNKHWSFTAGFFAGSSNIADAQNLDGELSLLQAVTAYNDFYVEYFSSGRNFAGYGEVAKITSLLTENGIAGFNLGRFKDGDLAIMVPGEGGIVRGDLKINKIRPYIGAGYNTQLGSNGKWRLTVDAGVMYLGKPSITVDNVYKINTSIIDPANEYYDIVRPNADWTDYEVNDYANGGRVDGIDIISDVTGLKGEIDDVVKIVSKFKFYPNASVTFSYRLF